MCFIKLLIEKRNDFEGLKGRLSVGLDKLLTTADEVSVMQDELVVLQPILIKTAKEADEMMEAIAIDQASAAKTKEAVHFFGVLELLYIYIFLEEKAIQRRTLNFTTKKL
jgi:dynein heavy chain